MPFRFRWLCTSSLLALLLSTAHGAPQPANPHTEGRRETPGRNAVTGASDGHTFLRGMTISCPGYGRIWGSREMERSLEELRGLGVAWAAIHPYAGVDRKGRVRFTPAEKTGYLTRAVELAREAGVQLFWKPHLAYWGSFDWRGDIEFGRDEERWRRFFNDYRAFIVDQARFAEASGIRLFSVGLEYEKTTGREKEWREVLAAVRQVYSGRITYSANWDRVEDVPFWDAVDLIGVQAYFPLSYHDDPSLETIRQGWERHLDQLRGLSQRHGKGILFAEIGYDVSPDAARAPWQRNSRESPKNRALQRRLMEVALDRIEETPFIEGMFWWKWIPGQRHGGDFSMRHAEPRATLERAWSQASTK